MLSNIWHISRPVYRHDLGTSDRRSDIELAHLWLEFHQNRSCGSSAICSMIYAHVYFHSKIYADMGFSCFNICMCVYGFIKWLKIDRKISGEP